MTSRHWAAARLRQISDQQTAMAVRRDTLGERPNERQEFRMSPCTIAGGIQHLPLRAIDWEFSAAREASACIRSEHFGRASSANTCGSEVARRGRIFGQGERRLG
jgi:hypothetical protein